MKTCILAGVLGEKNSLVFNLYELITPPKIKLVLSRTLSICKISTNFSNILRILFLKILICIRYLISTTKIRHKWLTAVTRYNLTQSILGHFLQILSRTIKRNLIFNFSVISDIFSWLNKSQMCQAIGCNLSPRRRQMKSRLFRIKS